MKLSTQMSCTLKCLQEHAICLKPTSMSDSIYHTFVYCVSFCDRLMIYKIWSSVILQETFYTRHCIGYILIQCYIAGNILCQTLYWLYSGPVLYCRKHFIPDIVLAIFWSSVMLQETFYTRHCIGYILYSL